MKKLILLEHVNFLYINNIKWEKGVKKKHLMFPSREH